MLVIKINKINDQSNRKSRCWLSHNNKMKNKNLNNNMVNNNPLSLKIPNQR